MKEFYVGQRIHIDTDNEQWGRVAEDAVVVEITDGDILAGVGGTIRADIIVPEEDAFPLDGDILARKRKQP